MYGKQAMQARDTKQMADRHGHSVSIEDQKSCLVCNSYLKLETKVS